MSRSIPIPREIPPHLLEPGLFCDTLLGVMARVVRNLQGHPFPGWSTAEDRRAVADELVPRLLKMPAFSRGSFHAEMPRLSFDDRRRLLLLNLLSPSMAARQDGCHLILSRKRDISVMVNEEEHLVLHIFREGCKCTPRREDPLGVFPLLDRVESLCSQLDKRFPFAHTREHGYLTSIPTECGDGVQLYAMLHLPALNFANMMGQVTKAMEKLHISISPFYSDNHDNTGSRFMLYSIPGPADSLNDMQEYFFAVVKRVVDRELSVRSRLADEPGQRILDHIGRTYGMLMHARRLNIKELRDAASALRLATVLGVTQWECGALDFIRGLDELCLTLVADAVTAGDEERVPLMLAERTRAFLRAIPHTIQTPDTQIL